MKISMLHYYNSWFLPAIFLYYFPLLLVWFYFNAVAAAVFFLPLCRHYPICGVCELSSTIQNLFLLLIPWNSFLHCHGHYVATGWLCFTPQQIIIWIFNKKTKLFNCIRRKTRINTSFTGIYKTHSCLYLILPFYGVRLALNTG